MVNMFQEKMAGDGNDPNELILQAFMAYDQGGKIDVKMFQHALMTWETRCPSLRLMTSSMSLRSMRTTWSRPRRLLDSLLLSRRKKLLLKLLQRRMKVMPRRGRRRRRRPPSK